MMADATFWKREKTRKMDDGDEQHEWLSSKLSVIIIPNLASAPTSSFAQPSGYVPAIRSKESSYGLFGKTE
jgi:hypothetical protein